MNLTKFNEVVQVKIIFQSVHKKHQFAELLNLTPNHNIEEVKEERVSRGGPQKDFKMHSVTWNMGGANQTAFVQGYNVIPNVP